MERKNGAHGSQQCQRRRRHSREYGKTTHSSESESESESESAFFAAALGIVLDGTAAVFAGAAAGAFDAEFLAKT